MMENKKCLTPPTRLRLAHYCTIFSYALLCRSSCIPSTSNLILQQCQSFLCMTLSALYFFSRLVWLFMETNDWLVVYLPLWKIWVRLLGWLFPIYGKIKNVPNHQPDEELCMTFVWTQPGRIPAKFDWFIVLLLETPQFLGEPFPKHPQIPPGFTNE